MKTLILVLLYSILWNQVSAKDDSKVENLKDEKKVSNDDASIEFKETKFLQVDKIHVPKELEMIEEQIKQNVVDVILVSQTHTPVYIQKREGYTDNYKKFFGLQVNISPSSAKNDYFDVGYFYYNWTTNKFDKSLFKRISKYNVINELRFGVYEILFGKEYVKKNKDVIDLQNYERIQAVRKAIATQKRLDKKKEKEEKKKKEEKELEEESNKAKKKKIIREDKEKSIKASSNLNNPSEEDQEAGPESQEETNKITNDSDTDSQSGQMDELKKTKKNKTKSKEKALKKSDTEKNNLSSNDPTRPPDLPPDEPKVNPSIKYLFNINGLAGFSVMYNDSLTSDKKIKAYSNFKYLTLGTLMEIVQDKDNPIGYTIDFLFGVPILKKSYEIPIYKRLDISVDKFDLIFKQSKWSIGIQYAPINFVNVPNFGENFQVFENDFVWAKFKYQTNFKGYTYGIAFLKSLLGQSSKQKEFSGQKMSVNASKFFTSKIGGEVKIEVGSLGGDLEVAYNYLGLNLIYHFEN